MPPIAGANLLQNGDFELGNYNNADQDSRPEIMLITPGMTNITGWSIQGTGGVHWLLGADIASSGNYSLDLQGVISGPLSSASTQFSSTTGQQYRLTFDTYAGLSHNTGTVSVGSLQGQSLLGPIKPPGQTPTYSSFSYDFIATAPISTLTFRVTNTDGYGPVIDNVTVTAVPEPAKGILLLVGIISLATHLRKREA